MRVVYSEKNLLSPPETSETGKKVTYKGRTYTYVGDEKEHMSFLTRGIRLVEVACFSLAAFSLAPLFFKGFRNTFKRAAKELISGEETVTYYAINPNISASKEKKEGYTPPPSEEDSERRGLEDSKRAYENNPHIFD